MINIVKYRVASNIGLPKNQHLKIYDDKPIFSCKNVRTYFSSQL